MRTNDSILLERVLSKESYNRSNRFNPADFDPLFLFLILETSKGFNIMFNTHSLIHRIVNS